MRCDDFIYGFLKATSSFDANTRALGRPVNVNA
jgi:hypothetical protein